MSMMLEDEQWLLHQSRPTSFALRRDPFVRSCVTYTGAACAGVTVLLVGIFICVLSYDVRRADEVAAAPVFPVRLVAQRHGPMPILCRVNVGLMSDASHLYRPIDLPGNYCSHLVLPLQGLFGWDNETVDLTTSFVRAQDHIGQLREVINKSYPHLKHLVSVGDEAHGDKLHFSDATPTNTTAYMIFLVDLVRWVIENKYSGLVLHRVFPIETQYRKHMVIFLSHLKQVLHRHGLLFVVTAPYDATIFKSGSRTGRLGKFLDYVAVITHGIVKAANTSERILLPFHHHHRKGKSIEDALETVITSGLPRNRVILTISLTGYLCTLANFPDKNSSVPNWNDAKALRMVTYKEVCKIVGTSNWTTGYDKESEKPYLVRNNIWIGYEDEISVRKLASLVDKMYLGGVLIWDVSNDDYSGQCGIRNPLVKSIFTEVEGTPLDESATSIISSFNASGLQTTENSRDTLKILK